MITQFAVVRMRIDHFRIENCRSIRRLDVAFSSFGKNRYVEP